jgi:copper chaperone
MANGDTAAGTSVDLRYRVEGMDCSGCALKIQVNYKTQTLEFRLNEATTPRSAVEEKIRGLGYGVAALA